MLVFPIIVNSHENNGKGWGNGGHGHCKHCGLALVTDLGYCSWEGTTCVDREATYGELDFPKDLSSYIRFKGLKYNSYEKTFCRPFDDHIYTVEELVKTINELKYN